MAYQDEELLRMRQKAEAFKQQQVSEDTLTEELKQSIHASVTYITKIPVVFEDKELMGGNLVMRVPRDFEQVPESVVAQQYVMENKPQYVYELPYLPFGLTFSTTEIPGDEARIEQMFPYMVDVVKKVGPGVRVLSSGKKVVHGIYLRWFDAIAQTVSEPSYRTIFVFPVQNKVAIGCLTCPSRLKKRYQPIMEEMLETLEFPKVDTEEAVEHE